MFTRRLLLAAPVGAAISLFPCFAQQSLPPAQLSPPEWASIRAAYDAGRHEVTAVDGGHRAHNPGQQWSTSWDGRGFTATPDTGGWQWGLELVRYGWGSESNQVVRPQSVAAAGGRLAYQWDDRLTEWYVNDRRGLEHGYTVAARPPAAGGPLVVHLAVRGHLVAAVSADGRDVRFVDESGRAVVCYAGLTVIDVAGRSLDASWQPAGGGLLLSVDDRGACYPLTIDPIASQQAYLKASNTNAGDNFGFSVAISGDTAVVGAPMEDSSTSFNPTDNSVSSAGAAYVFVRSGSAWSQQAYLKAQFTGAGDYFGRSVAVSGDTIVVGAPLESSNATGINGNQLDNSVQGAGAAYVFVRSGGSWTQQAYLKASNTDFNDGFGSRVVIDGNTIAVSATGERSSATGVNGNELDNSVFSSGAVYVFTRSGTVWSQQAYLKASNNRAASGSFLGGMLFGSAIGLSGDTIVVGAPGEQSNATGVNGNQNDSSITNAGAAYVFIRSGTSWSQQSYLKASNNHSLPVLLNFGMFFGSAVGISGDTIVVGAPRDESGATGVNGNELDQSAPESGAGYVFLRSGATWSQQAYLKASNTGAADGFGSGVAIAGNTIVVAAPGEDSAAVGVNGNQSDDSMGGAGAGYVFVRRGTTWSQQVYVKASNTGSGDSFGDFTAPLLVGTVRGSSVAVSGATVLVGAAGEDSNATGVDGLPFNDTAAEAGAAYIFQVHDECADAALLRTGLNAGLSTVGATTSTPPMSCGNGGSDVWYEYTPACTGPHQFDTCSPGTNFNTVLELYSGSCGALTSIACNDDSCGQASSITADLTQGVTYHLRLGGVGGSTGTADIHVLCQAIDPAAFQQAYVKASNTDVGDNFGFAVAVSGDTMVASTFGEDSIGAGVNANQLDNSALNAGAAYVFVRNGTTWSQQAYLKASNTDPGDQFGQCVAIDGDTIVVGAPGEGSSATGINGPQTNNSAIFSGAVYVFVRNGTTWTQQAYLKASNTGVGDLFGQSVAIAGNTIVVGAIGERSNTTGVNGNQTDNSLSQAGAAYVFVRSGTTWSQQAYLKASNTEANDGFGYSVAIANDVIVIGAPFEDSSATGANGNQLDNSAPGSGAAYVFQRTGTTWSQIRYLKASNTGGGVSGLYPGDFFGWSVAVCGGGAAIIVGAPNERSNATGINGNQADNSLDGAGAAYAFRGLGAFQAAYIKASNTGANDQFGYSVAGSGVGEVKILVGAPYEDSDATGVNCDELDNSASSAGAVYAFALNGPVCTQFAYLKASNTGPNDQFGCAVAVAGNNACCGAMNEDGGAIGVNGNELDDSAFDAGAAYHFVLVPNDECTGAIALTLGSNPDFNTVGATTSTPPMGCGSASSDLWFTYTAASTAPHTFDTCGPGTNFNTVLELYGGSCGALVSLACNDDACGTRSSVTASLVQGVTYYLRLGGFSGSRGLADINVATGTGTGSLSPSTTISACPSTATLSVSGNPNIGGTITMVVNNFTGFPLTGYGFAPNVHVPTPCGCDVVGGFFGPPGEFFFGASTTLTIPSNPLLIGLQAELQGLDYSPASGGCTYLGIPFGATDITTITVG